MIREPIAAGRFYPRESSELGQVLERLVPHEPSPTRALAIMTPHGSYPHSGPIAGAVYAAVAVPRVCFLLSTSHAGMGEDAALMTEGSWKIPTGEVPVHREYATRLLEMSPHLRNDDLPHRMEHALELQLPFLRHCNPDVSIVPLSFKYYTSGRTFVSASDWFARIYPKVENIGHALAKVIESSSEPAMIVLSSDLNHYENLATTRTKDGKAIAALLELDAETLLNVVMTNSISMCGAVPAAVTLIAARQLGARSARLIKYGTSAEASGDELMVVGYAGVVIE